MQEAPIAHLRLEAGPGALADEHHSLKRVAEALQHGAEGLQEGLQLLREEQKKQSRGSRVGR